MKRIVMCVVMVLAALPAHAQMIDYESLQSVFGEPITTSAIGTPQRASDVPANMTIITADQIRQSGSRNIPEILRQVPGIDIMQTGIESYEVGVRGYNQPLQPRLLVLLNGRQVFLDDYSRTDWNAIPVDIDNIRQIEVVKGPNAALFGNNAVGGVVNIVTYNPFYDKVNVANVTGGSQTYEQADVTISNKISDWAGLRISGGGLNANEFDTSRTQDEEDFTISPMRRYVAADGVFQVTPSMQGEVEATYTKSSASAGSLLNAFGESLSEVTSLKAGLTSQTNYGLVKLTSYLNHENTSLLLPSAGQTIIDNLYVTQLEDQFKIGTNHTFRIAAEYRNSYAEYEEQEVLPTIHPELDTDTLSASAMWNWQIAHNLSFTNAVRVDQRYQMEVGTLLPNSYFSSQQYKSDFTGVNANSGLVWQATDVDTLRATYGRGMQYPSLYEAGAFYSVSSMGDTFVFQGNPVLKPTVVTNYELDYDRQIKPWFSTLRTAVFYTDNRDVPLFSVPPSQYIITGSLITITDENIGGSHAFGGEIGFAGSKDGFRWGGSYSLANVTDDPQVLTLVHYERSTPQNSVKLNAGYTYGPWEFDAFGYYVSSRQSLTSDVIGGAAVYTVADVDGYASISGRVAYNINDHFTLALSGTGLNKQYFDVTGFPDIERQVFLSLTGKF